MATPTRASQTVPFGQPFDLNMEHVLEHWPVAFAVRELIANALDEHAMTSTPEPCVEKAAANVWVIRDFGRGLRHEHLTQNENAEKRRYPAAIGQFGIGLKDALAVCDRHGVSVLLLSRHGDIETGCKAKDGFPDVVTLHGFPPSDPNLVGTEVTLTGLGDEDVDTARSFFLRYQGDVRRPARSAAVGRHLPRHASPRGHPHARTCLVDGTLAFEDALTQYLGVVASHAAKAARVKT